MDADATLVKENARLRKEIAGYQNALEEMEVRAKKAEASARDLAKKLTKVKRDVLAAVAEPGDGCG